MALLNTYLLVKSNVQSKVKYSIVNNLSVFSPLTPCHCFSLLFVTLELGPTKMQRCLLYLRWVPCSQAQRGNDKVMLRDNSAGGVARELAEGYHWYLCTITYLVCWCRLGSNLVSWMRHWRISIDTTWNSWSVFDHELYPLPWAARRNFWDYHLLSDLLRHVCCSRSRGRHLLLDETGL